METGSPVRYRSALCTPPLQPVTHICWQPHALVTPPPPCCADVVVCSLPITAVDVRVDCFM